MIELLALAILLPLALGAIGFTAFWSAVFIKAARISKERKAKSNENLI